jgi:hypothetical protein
VVEVSGLLLNRRMFEWIARLVHGKAAFGQDFVSPRRDDE